MLTVETTCLNATELRDGTALFANLNALQSLASNDIRKFYRKAYRFLGNTHDAEDAVQDAFLSAYQHLSDFKGRARLSTWFTTVVINSARMQLRRRRHSRIPVDQQFRTDDETMNFGEAFPDHRPGPEEIWTRAEVDKVLRRSIDQLSPTLRRAARICFLDGLNAAQAAGVLGLPLGTVKAQMARARAQLTRSVRKTLGLEFSRQR
jgi:RNA polymerase sigma-70 factor (ECF subfamily)